MRNQAMLILDECPRSCLECPLRYHAEDFPKGNFTYRKMFKCRFAPMYLDEDEGDIVYLNDIMLRGKPPWCPLKEIESED